MKTKLTLPEIVSIRFQWNHSGISHRKLAKKYNISKSQINRIVNYQNWKS